MSAAEFRRFTMQDIEKLLKSFQRFGEEAAFAKFEATKDIFQDPPGEQ